MQQHTENPSITQNPSFYDLTHEKVEYQSGLRLPNPTEFVAKNWPNKDKNAYRILAIANTHLLPETNRIQHFVQTSGNCNFH